MTREPSADEPADAAAPDHASAEPPPTGGVAALAGHFAALPFAPNAVPEQEARAARLLRLRHSCAHIMAEAVVQLFPDARVATGPAVEHGFFYDFELPRPLTPDDLPEIERRMKKIIKRGTRFETTTVPLGQARAAFAATDQTYKVEVLDRIAVEQAGGDQAFPVRLYRQGAFTDLCAGPHVASAKAARHVKLLRVSGAYWRGDQTRPMLQRVVGTAWESEEDLQAYLTYLEQARLRNHKRIGQELDLFTFHPFAPGAPFWTPRGYLVYQEFLAYWRESHRRRGYQEIFNPVLYKRDLYERSGHYAHYKGDMFILEADDTEYCLKPMNCPDTFLFYTSRRRSFRELPLRVSEGGILHRNELTGALNGLFRVRQFTQDDAHIFVRDDQVQDEIAEILDLVREVYGLFELRYDFTLSTRPASFMGAPELWDRAEEALRAALERSVPSWHVAAGDGAFYGPKIDIQVTDCLGRRWQCATIQLDFQQPINFDMKYVDSDNQSRRPIVIHRAIFGSFERFFGILLEHTGGALPTWLSPVQAVVIPISDKVMDYAWQVHAWLAQRGIRAEVDERAEKMNYKVRQAELRKVPYMLVVGEREAEQATVSLRSWRLGPRGAHPVDHVAGEIAQAIASRAFDVDVTPLATFADDDSDAAAAPDAEY
jgi:threonyl-tRNA synthetase